MTETTGQDPSPKNDTTLQIPTIAGKLDETSTNKTNGKKKVPRKILHFSDGVLEEYSTDEEEEEVEESNGKEVVDPRSLTWAPWLYWRAWSAGGNVVSVLDTVGEKLAWWMGITSPKYYYEIQEAIRMKEEEEKRRKEEDAEMSGWQEQPGSSPVQPRSDQPSPEETRSNMGDVAAAVLAAEAEKERNLPSIVVEKPLDLELDLGNMLAIDNNQIETSKLEDIETRDAYLTELARDNTQILINAIWQLPTHRVEEVVVATFPPPTYKLPREKPLPEPKAETKWEKYAKEKGIVKKKKKDRVVWDEVVKQWVPQYGFKKKVVEDQKNWCIPIKETANPILNPHEELEKEKSERKAKNELQRLRNLARAKNINVPTVGVVTPSDATAIKTSYNPADDLQQNAEIARISTASLGKFQPRLGKKLEGTAKPKAKKRKFESNTWDSKEEKERNMGILQSLTNKKSHIDLNMATSVAKKIRKEERDGDGETDRQQPRKGKKGKGKRSKPEYRKGGSKAVGKKKVGGKSSFGGKSKGKKR